DKLILIDSKLTYRMMGTELSSLREFFAFQS
ncbi:unnamed protein product, partial [marine sediment metagenome]